MAEVNTRSLFVATSRKRSLQTGRDEEINVRLRKPISNQTPTVLSLICRYSYMCLRTCILVLYFYFACFSEISLNYEYFMLHNAFSYIQYIDQQNHFIKYNKIQTLKHNATQVQHSLKMAPGCRNM